MNIWAIPLVEGQKWPILELVTADEQGLFWVLYICSSTVEMITVWKWMKLAASPIRQSFLQKHILSNSIHVEYWKSIRWYRFFGLELIIKKLVELLIAFVWWCVAIRGHVKWSYKNKNESQHVNVLKDKHAQQEPMCAAHARQAMTH